MDRVLLNCQSANLPICVNLEFRKIVILPKNSAQISGLCRFRSSVETYPEQFHDGKSFKEAPIFQRKEISFPFDLFLRILALSLQNYVQTVHHFK